MRVKFHQLSELVDPSRGISYGIVQPGCHQEDGIPIVRVTDIRDGRIATANPLRVSSDIEAKYARTRLRGGELLLTLVGTVGETAVVPEDLRGWNTARAVAVIPVCERVGARWIVYALKSSPIRREIEMRLNTTVQATLNLGDVAALKIPVPDENIRHTILSILGSLDDKIELNRRMNATLEAMARALFKSWFVDFDPVRAKLAGREAACLDKDTDALFPSKFEDSPLGNIPKGWRSGAFSDSFKIPLRNGLTRPKGVRGAGVLMVNMGELFAHRRIGNIPMDRVPLSAAEFELNLVESGDLLFARQSLTLAGAGQCSIIVGADEPRTYESHLIRCRLDLEKSSPWFFFYYFLSPPGRARIVSIVEQVAAAGIRGSDLARMTVLTPPIEIQNRFAHAVLPFEQRIALNNDESRTLATLRDTLLPKLLSGDLRVA